MTVECQRRVWKFGIMGAGKIASDFVAAMSSVSDRAVAVAVASRSMENSQAFASMHGIKSAYGSYDELLQDKEVDIVYISTIHPVHKECVIRSLEAGKHVIVEKPIALSAADAAEMINLARKYKLFLLEAMWTRFFPAVRKALEMIRNGAIGRIREVRSDFGFVADASKRRLFDVKMGGGSLLDIGIYPVAAATLVLGSGKPLVHAFRRIAAAGIVEDGVDVACGATIVYDDSEGEPPESWMEPQRTATISCSLRAPLPEITTYIGSEGFITLSNVGHAPTRLELSRGTRSSKISESFDFPLPAVRSKVDFNFEHSEGLAYEVCAVCDALGNGLTECPEYSLDNCLEVNQILDECRRQLGVHYQTNLQHR